MTAERRSGARSGAQETPARSSGQSVPGPADSRRPRHKRLSADLPQHWLHDPPYWSLSDRAWRLHTHALMFAIGRTDGFIGQGMLSLLLPGSDADRDLAVKELAAAGHWQPAPGGWQVADWEQSQSTVAEVEANRRREREKKRRQRASVPRGRPLGDSTGGVRNGTERQGMAPKGERSSDVSQPQTCTRCDRPARRGCRTCFDHMTLESTP